MLPVFVFLYSQADINLTLIEKLVNGICLCIHFFFEFPVPLLFTKPMGFISFWHGKYFTVPRSTCMKMPFSNYFASEAICCRKKISSYKFFFSRNVVFVIDAVQVY